MSMKFVSVDEFYKRVNELTDTLQPGYLKLLRDKYAYFREYQFHLGGVLLGLIEQSYLLNKDKFFAELEKACSPGISANRESFGQTYSSQEQCIRTLKSIHSEKQFETKIAKLKDKCKDILIEKGCEQIVKSILLKNTKVDQQDQYSLKQSSSMESSVLITPTYLSIIQEIFSAEITLITCYKSSKICSFQCVKNYKREFSLTLYCLPNSPLLLGITINQKKLFLNIGDDFLPLKEAKEQYDKTQERKNSRASEKKLSTGASGSSRMPNKIYENGRLCSKCLSFTENDLLFHNLKCDHYICNKCAQKRITASKTYPHLKGDYCPLTICSANMDTKQVTAFLETCKSFIQNKSDIASQKQKNAVLPQTIPSNQRELAQSQMTNRVCAVCGQEKKEDEYSMQKYCHPICFKCINKEVNESKKYNRDFIRCPKCYMLLRISEITQPLRGEKNSPAQTSKDIVYSLSKEEKQNKIDSDKSPEKSNFVRQCSQCHKILVKMLKSNVCKHELCLQCCIEVLQTFTQQQRSYSQCPDINCKGMFKKEDISDFIEAQKNEQKIGDVGDMGKSQQISPERSRNQQLLKMQDSIMETWPNKCSICREKKENEKMYEVQACGHKYCLQCIIKNQDVHDGKCYLKYCGVNINEEELDDFLFKEQQQKSINTSNVNKFSVICSGCKKTDEIDSASKPDYFKCTTCHKMTCLIHDVLASECKCFCEKCNNQCTKIQNTIICTKCNYSFCNDCKNTTQGTKACTCICKICGLSSQGGKSFCKCFENTCSYCFNSFENIYLNSFNDTLIRKNELCMHFFCNSCYYQKVIQETNSGSGKRTFVCLLC